MMLKKQRNLHAKNLSDLEIIVRKQTIRQWNTKLQTASHTCTLTSIHIDLNISVPGPKKKSDSDELT